MFLLQTYYTSESPCTIFFYEKSCKVVERIEKALFITKTKKFKLVGTLRNEQKEYAIVFTATDQGEQIPSENLLSVVFEKQKVHTLLQVITYWVNDNKYMIDVKIFQNITVKQRVMNLTGICKICLRIFTVERLDDIY